MPRPRNPNSAANIKRSIREHFGHKCCRCQMTNAEHIELTGRSLHLHRIVKRSAYSIAGCKLLCIRCHSTEHGAETVTVRRKLKPRPKGKPVMFRFTPDDLARIDRISRHLSKVESWEKPTMAHATRWAIFQACKLFRLGGTNGKA